MTKYKLRKKDWDDQEACKKESIRLGFTSRIGYLAWTAGQGANGYESVLDFFDDIFELKRHLLKDHKGDQMLIQLAEAIRVLRHEFRKTALYKIGGQLADSDNDILITMKVEKPKDQK